MTSRRLIHDEKGAILVEFVAIAPLFFALFFAAIEFSLALYWWKSAEKASQLGVRTAVVRDAAAPGVPSLNTRSGAGILGQPCRETPSPCVDFGQIECSGAGCSGAGFDMVLSRMQNVFPVIEADNVRILYEYIGLGYAGGPAVPAVTVTLTGIEYPLFVLGQLFALFNDDGNVPNILPDIRATLTGEDLQTGSP